MTSAPGTQATTAPPPLVVVRLHGNDTHCLVVVAPGGRPPARAIRPVEIVGQFELVDGEPKMVAGTFARGRDFAEFLHGSIARHGPAVPGLAEGAKGQHGTYVYVIDGRTPTPQGSVPPEDILGSFRVENGQISAASYQRFPAHRLFTERGFFQLPDAFISALLTDLEASLHSER